VVRQYLGDTGPKVKRAIRDAKNGCLFLDEAYSLAEGGGDASGGGDAFAKDAVRTLLTEVASTRAMSLSCPFGLYVHINHHELNNTAAHENDSFDLAEGGEQPHVSFGYPGGISR
jgi:hypothetical protein